MYSRGIHTCTVCITDPLIIALADTGEKSITDCVWECMIPHL